MKLIDTVLNKITMYRVVLYYLILLLGVAFFYGFIGVLPYDPTALAFSTVLILLTCMATNWIFARTFKAAANVESTYITALILALIITPVTASNHVGVGFLIIASVWAMASKYIFAIGNKHLFNPAAFAVALTALTIGQTASWWVAGNIPMLPFILVGGLLVVRKVRRFDLVGSFAVVALATTLLTTPSVFTTGDFMTPITQTLLYSSFFFLAFAMLSEPLTTPPTTPLRVADGAVVGFLFAPNIHVGSFYFTPEMALLVGNIFSYLVSPKGRLVLTLVGVERMANDAYDFVFSSDRTLAFRPGQYLEWTLAHTYPDNRGNRRYFTIASAPTEKNIILGVKFYDPASTFKHTLAAMKPGDTLTASHLSGGFVLPKNKTKKLVFIAGGIGVTPFRSMIHYLLDRHERRDIIVLYSNKTAADIAYKDVFDRAQAELGIKTVYALSAEKQPLLGMFNGTIDAKLIAQQVPDFRERTFYISGPRVMVDAFTTTLTQMGVSRFHIKSDFFPGFA